MKKLFSIFAIAALCLTACNKEPEHNSGRHHGGGGDPEYVAPIKIDADFSDWAKLDASKVATATLPEGGASKEALKVLKVYADEVFVYIYFEWDTEMIEYEPDVEHVPFHIYLNGDGDNTTGGFSDQFTDAATDFLAEGFLTDGTNLVNYGDGVSCFAWDGEVNGSGWTWSDVDSGAGLFQGAGVAGKYEIAMTRELYPLGKLADEFSIGIDIQQSWDSVGVLPIGEDGYVEALKVVTNK